MNRTSFATVFGIVAFFAAGALFAGGSTESESESATQTEQPGPTAEERSAVPSTENARTAVFAGGCFWCMEEAFEKVHGVLEAVSGYAGGTTENPTYYEVTSGTTGHAEVVRVFYDPEIVTYEDLLYVFWRNVDLLDAGGQFCDRGNSYRTGIFYSNNSQRRAAEASKREIEESGRFDLPVVTEITELEAFYEAEGYHQDYYINDAVRYSFYKSACGRERRLIQLWGDQAGGGEFVKE